MRFKNRVTRKFGNARVTRLSVNFLSDHHPGLNGRIDVAVSYHPLPVDEDHLDTGGGVGRLGERVVVFDGFGIEDRYVGRKALLEEPPVFDGETLRSGAGHLPDRLLQREEFLVS